MNSSRYDLQILSFAKFQLPRRLFTGDDLRCEGETLPECYLDRLFTGGDLLHRPFLALFDDLDSDGASTSLRRFWPPLLSNSGQRHRNGFQKFEKIKDSSRQSRQLEELAGKMGNVKGLLKSLIEKLRI